jgi:hypothetical protein
VWLRLAKVPGRLPILLANQLVNFVSSIADVLLWSGYSVVLPLSIVCIAIVVGIPAAAARARLHIPGYVGLASLSFAIALLLGWLSGARALAGTIVGFVLSIVFFLLIAAAVGSVVALFFYRQPKSE